VRTVKFDGVVIASIECSFSTKPNTVRALAALVSTTTGETFGHTTRETWSPRTMELLVELRKSMADDIENNLFADKAADAVSTLRDEEPAGLAELLNEGVPQG